jgi:hypothetical protein
MTRKAYESDPLPFSLNSFHYRQGGPNDYLPVVENPNVKNQSISLEGFLSLIRQDHQGIKVPTTFGTINALPTRMLHMGINREEVLRKNLIPQNILERIEREDIMQNLLSMDPQTTPPSRSIDIPENMVFRVKGGGLEKNTLMILDIIANNNWERPVYFNNTSIQAAGIDFRPYVVQEGSTYRLLPLQNMNPREELVNTEAMYRNMLTGFFFREMNNPDVYYSEDYRNFALNHRSSFNTLADALYRDGEIEKAKEVLNYNLKVMPDEAIPYDYTTAQTVSLLYQVGETEKARNLAVIISKQADEMLGYYLDNGYSPGNEIQKNLIVMNEMVRVLKLNKEDSLAANVELRFMDFYNRVNQ